LSESFLGCSFLEKRSDDWETRAQSPNQIAYNRETDIGESLNDPSSKRNHVVVARAGKKKKISNAAGERKSFTAKALN